MIRAYQIPLFDVILTLALVAAASDQAVSLIEAGHNSQCPRLALPDQLAGFNKILEKSVTSNQDYAEQLYARGNRRVRVYVRRFNALDKIHDFRDCLNANGFDPVERGVLQFADSRGGKMEAAEISTRYGPAISLLWFQLGSNAHGDRWSWRKDLLLHAWEGKEHCKEFRVATEESDNLPGDITELKHVAVALNGLDL